ncbi:MAG: hypothetical protein HYV28_05175 [Ignavibacteriales bacterium]|nr:hypothetical protein [Ignavibacteriales bacterium]
MYKYIFLLLIGILPAQKIENAVQPEDYKFEIYKSAQQIQTLVESNRGIYLDNVLVMQVVQQSRNQTARIIAKEDISAFDTIAKIDGFSIFVSQIDSINTEQALAKLQVHYSFEGKNYLVEKEVFCKKDRGKWKFAMDFNSDSFFQRLKTITYKQKSQGKNKETFAIRESPYAMIQTSFSDNPYILELNKSLAQSYLNDDIFSEATELDGDVIWYGPNWPEDVAAFVIDRDLSQIVYGDYNYSQWTVKGYGRNDNDFHFARAEAITTDYNNNVYVADFGLNAIIKLHYNTSSRMLEFVKKIEVKGNPVDVAFTQEISPYGTEGYLYVAINNSVDKILLLNTDGVLRDSYKSYTTDLQTYSDIIRPSRITCNKRSAFCFYFIDDIKRSFQSVYKWGWGDGTLFCSNKTEFPGNSCPTDVGIDGNSNPIVLDRGNGCLHTFSLTGKYLCSYKLTGGINSPKRISNYGSIKPGYYCINNTLSEQWSLTSGLRAFYTGADVFDLQFSILDEQRYCFSYIPSGCIQRKVEILDQNNCLIKTLANDSWCGDLHTFEVLKSELPLASGLKFKVHYLPVDNAHFGSDAQPWRTKEITFNTMVAPTIAGISPNIIKVRQGSATQVSAYLQPGPVGTVGYFWAGDLFPAGAVIEQDGSPVATIRYNRNKAKEMQNFSFSPKTPSSIGVLAQNFIGMAGFSKPVEFIKARSCPFIYTWQDSLWVEDNNILPQSQDEGQRGVLTDDYYNLYTKPALTADETYRLAIGEFEQEQSFIDLTKLIIVDHPLETDITVDDSGRVYQFAKPLKPRQILTLKCHSKALRRARKNGWYLPRTR